MTPEIRKHLPAKEHTSVERSPSPKAQLRWIPREHAIVAPDVRSRAFGDEISSRSTVLTPETVQEVINEMSPSQVAVSIPKLLKHFPSPAEGVQAIMERHGADFVANNLKKLLERGVNATQLAEMLMESEKAYAVANNLEKFPEGSVDATQLVEILMKSGEAYAVANNLEKFPEGSVDATQLVEILMKSGEAYAVANNLEKFPKGSVDATQLVEMLMKSGAAYAVADNLEKFPKGSVNAAKLTEILMKSGHAYVVANNLKKFLERGVDATQLAKMLMESGKAYVVVGSMDKFLERGMDATQLAEMLMRSRNAHIVAENLEKFPKDSVDVTELAEILMESEYAYVVAENLEKFPEGSVDATELAEILMESEYAYVVANNLEKFPEGSVDAAKLAKMLMKSGLAYAVADNLEKFPEGSVDAAKLAKMLIHTERPYVVTNNLDKFLERGVNVTQLAEMFTGSEKAYVVGDNLEKFLERGVNVTKLTKALMKGGHAYIVAENLEKFPKVVISREIERSLPIPINDALAQHRYRHVEIWMKNAQERYGKESLRWFFDLEMAMEEWNALVQDGRIENAKALGRCMELAGMPAPEIPPPATAEQEELPRMVDTETHAVTDEVLSFYAGSALEARILAIKSSPDWSYKLDLKDRVALEDVQRAIKKNVACIAYWLKEYMVYAVMHELENQPDSGLKVQKQDSSYFFSREPREGILNFFDAASARFTAGGWRDETYGGPAWSLIADAGYALFASKGDLSPIIDLIFDLQHNTGTVFNKNPERVVQQSTELQTLLSAKREKDMEVILKQADGICSASTIAGIQARFRILERLEKKEGIVGKKPSENNTTT